MENQNLKQGPIAVIKSSVQTLLTNKIILLPFVLIVLIQFLVLEILYFIPRFPLNSFFTPIVSRIWNEIYMHYPYNIVLLPKLFQIAQIGIFIFFSGFLITVAIAIIARINSGEEVNVNKLTKSFFPYYVHILAATLLTFMVVMGFYELYDLLLKRALLIRSAQGPFFWLKTTIVMGAPYFNFFLSVVTMVLFAYLLPLIAIERFKIFKAILENFKMLFRSFWSTFFIVFLPSLLYVFVIFLRGNIPFEAHFPEMRVIFLILSVIFSTIIDAVIYTGLTVFYLFKKESK